MSALSWPHVARKMYRQEENQNNNITGNNKYLSVSLSFGLLFKSAANGAAYITSFFRARLVVESHQQSDNDQPQPDTDNQQHHDILLVCGMVWWRSALWHQAHGTFDRLHVIDIIVDCNHCITDVLEVPPPIFIRSFDVGYDIIFVT